MFIAQRRWLLAGAALVFLVSAVVAWRASAVVGGATLGFGLGALVLMRVHAAMREMYRHMGEITASSEYLRARLALAERRLAALAIKMNASDELDEPRP